MKNWFLSLDKKYQIVLVLIGLVFVYVAYRKIRNAIKGITTTNKPFVKENIPENWNPEPLARKIFETLEGYNWLVYPEISEEILALNDDQIIFLSNYYNKNLASEYDTLAELFANEWNQSQGKYNQVVSKLKSLNLK